MLRLGLVQASASSDAAENFNTIRQFAAEGGKNGCAALCFPEAFLTGYFPHEASALALQKDHPLFSRMAALAQTQKTDLLVGFMEREENRFYLTHGIWRADGIAAFYRKTHLGQKERAIFSPGDHLEIFSLSCGLRVGIQLCVETHFPEITQLYSLGGAEVIFAPHASPISADKRRKLWQKYIPARSYDNRVYVACCNLWDPVRFGGGCMLTDPQGDVVVSSFENAPGLISFDIDPECVGHYHLRDSDRSHYYYPGRRRPELYSSENETYSDPFGAIRRVTD